MLNRLPRRAQVLLLVLLTWLVAAAPVAWSQVYYVDDDAAQDPGPNDPGVSDPLEDGTQEHPFDSVQEAIDFLLNPCELHIMPGSFTETLNLPGGGCLITGSGKGATVINGVAGVSINLDSLGPMVLRNLTLQHGTMTVFSTSDISIQDTALIDVQAVLRVSGQPTSVSLRGSEVIDSTFEVSGGGLGNETVIFDMAETTMSGGSLQFFTGEGQYIDVSNVVAPSTSIMLTRCCGGYQELTLRDSVFSSVVNGDAYASTLRIASTHFTGNGITAFHGEGAHELTVTDSTFDQGGIAIHNIPDIDVNPLAQISIRRCRFNEGGVSMTSRLYTFDPPFGASLSLSVDSSTFERDGISAVSTFEQGDVGSLDIALTNNVLSTPLTGVRIEMVMPDADQTNPTLSQARTAISNNTFVGSGRGIQMVTNTHVAPVIGAITSISNNIVIGGDIGVEVLGTIDHTVTAQNNDVWANTTGNWAGDIPDQTGMNGNISVDPLLVDAGAGDYHLAPNSPCIDTGVAGPSIPAADHDGLPRPLDGDLNGSALHDIGAFEFAPDADADGSNVVADCDDNNPSAWATPGEVRNVAFADAASFAWEAPLPAGGTFSRYDTLRSAGPADFLGSAVCIESDDALDSQAVDAAQPLPGEAYFYLVRAENACVPGQGPLGFRSDGTPRPGRSCP